MRKGIFYPFSHIVRFLSKYLTLESLHWSKVLNQTIRDFVLAHVHIIFNIIISYSKVFKLQRDSSVILNISPKTPISAEKLKITSAKINIWPLNCFPEWFGLKEIEPKRFWKYFMKNSSNWCFQRNVYSNLKTAHTLELCYNRISFLYLFVLNLKGIAKYYCEQW